MDKDPNAYLDPYGLWKITTEGDCEGKSTRHIGIFEGYIDDLALRYANKAMYALEFEKIDPVADDLPPMNNKQANVQLSIDSGTWDMDRAERVNFVETMLKDRPVKVEGSNYFGSFKIISDHKTEKEILEEDLEAKGFDPEEIKRILNS